MVLVQMLVEDIHMNDRNNWPLHQTVVLSFQCLENKVIQKLMTKIKKTTKAHQLFVNDKGSHYIHSQHFILSSCDIND